jgi:phage-related protein
LTDVNLEVKLYLLRLGAGRWGEVLAPRTDRGDCELLDFLEGLGPNDAKHRDWAMRLLCDHVPVAGPPKNDEVSKVLEDGIFEFRHGPIRILYFYDHIDGAMVICTHGYYKRTRKAPRGEIKRAKAHRTAYRAAKDRGLLAVEDL